MPSEPEQGARDHSWEESPESCSGLKQLRELWALPVLSTHLCLFILDQISHPGQILAINLSC